MKASEHPEYDLFGQDRQLVERCRRAVAAWLESGESLADPRSDGNGRSWTPQRARAFVLEVRRFFQAYNRVLWQEFSYCRTCRGGCCVVGASQVTHFDAVALALLEEPFPGQPQRAGPGDCIYLTGEGCGWPAAWRPLKCWAFYCLGSGDWELDAADARYERITQALQGVLETHLPTLLEEYERQDGESFRSVLADPISFADKLGAALMEIFVAPFEERFPLGATRQTQAPGAGWQEAVLAFIAEAVETVWAAPPAGPERLPVSARQFLSDLETMEWCLVARPQKWEERLDELQRRYEEAPVPAPGEDPTLWYQMRGHVKELRSQMMDRRQARG